MRLFLTGGTGLLGNTILRQWTDAGHHAVALVREPPAAEIFAGVDVELVHGDLGSVEVIEQAIGRSDVVIHAAGLIHVGWTRREESMRINHDGTRVVAEACLKHDRKLIHVGSVNTLAVSAKHSAADEETPREANGGQVLCDYVVSKRAGVDEVRAAVDRGLRATIVHPGFMLGPWDWKPSSGRMMLEVGRMWRPLAPAGGCSVCDSRDVARATIEAIEHGVDQGRDYILAGVNLSYKALWTEMARRMGSRPPVMRMGPIPYYLGSWFGDGWAKCSGHEGDVNSAAIAMGRQYHWYDSSRAREELGYQTRDLDESLEASAAWIKSHHLPA